MSLYPNILIVEDEENTRNGLALHLESQDYEVLTAPNAKEALKIIKTEHPEIVLSDIRMPEEDGLSLMEKILALDPQTRVILLTAYGSVEDAVKAMKKGAFYYLTKPVNLEELDFLIRKASANINLERENSELRKDLFREKYDQGSIIGESSKLKKVLQTVRQVAQSNSTVLIEGESGTGKELIAHRIHELSGRKYKPFIAVHCAALTESLMASELFGHEKGAFTGASERKIGRFERAHDGSLFLDEIGELTPETQVKLLRVLQEGEIERVGSAKSIKVDVRIICATNKNLAKEVQEGRFREDLFYRLNVINLSLPPLRERQSDIPILIQHFMEHYARMNSKMITELTPEAMDALTKYDWPGNIRELRNIIERMVVLSTTPTIDLEAVPIDIRQEPTRARITSKAQHTTAFQSLTEIERDYIREALEKFDGNKSLVAKKLGISRRTLYRKMDELDL